MALKEWVVGGLVLGGLWWLTSDRNQKAPAGPGPLPGVPYPVGPEPGRDDLTTGAFPPTVPGPVVNMRRIVAPRCAGAVVPPWTSTIALCLQRIGFPEEAQHVLNLVVKNVPETPEFTAHVTYLLSLSMEQVIDLHQRQGETVNFID